MQTGLFVQVFIPLKHTSSELTLNLITVKGSLLIGLFAECILWYVIQCDEDEANPTAKNPHNDETKLIRQTVHFGQRGQAGIHPQEGPERRGHQVCPPRSLLP